MSSAQFEARIVNELEQHATVMGVAQPNDKQPANVALFETMTTIEEEQTEFLWKNRIPRGKLTLFDGDPGIGKSYTALAIAAALSKGQALPFDQEPENLALASSRSLGTPSVCSFSFWRRRDSLTRESRLSVLVRRCRIVSSGTAI